MAKKCQMCALKNLNQGKCLIFNADMSNEDGCPHFTMSAQFCSFCGGYIPKGGIIEVEKDNIYVLLILPVTLDTEKLERNGREIVRLYEDSGLFIVDEDGNWYEKGEMGWFGVAFNEKSAESWDKYFQDYLDELKLSELNIANWDTKNVVCMECLFDSCESLTELNLTNWNVSNATSMKSLFRRCYELKTVGDLSNWKTGNVTNMGWIFEDCFVLESIGDLSNWDTSKVTNMESTFNYCHKLKELNLANWDTSKVINMYLMFIKCYELELLNLSGWDITLVEETNNMFADCEKLSTVIMDNSDYNSINKIIEKLPIRLADDPGTLDIAGVDDISQVDITTLNSKYWTVTSHTILNNARLGQTKLN